MEQPAIDHLVVAANNLDEGTDYIVDTLGVQPQGGGEHTAMGTHNRVLRLGPECYLEVIAINPEAPRPEHPRWFELDTEAMRAKLRQRPRLITWAIRTDRIDELSQHSSYPLGKVQPMSRGILHWRLTLREDGTLAEGGLIPFLIQWQAAAHPAAAMPDSGCRLVKLCGLHSHPEVIIRVLQSLEAEHLLELKSSGSEFVPYLMAVIETPGGLRGL